MPGAVYAASGIGLLRSDDSGASWRELINLGYVQSLASGGSSVLYAATSQGFFRSLDGGETWTSQPTPGVGLLSIAADPSNPSTVFGAGGSEVYKSTDQGATWSLIYDFGGGTAAGWIGVDPKNSSVLYVSFQTGGTIFKSLDGGQSWNVIFPGGGYVLFAPFVVALAIDSQNSSNLYAGTFTAFPSTISGTLPVVPGSISKSGDGGQTWRIIENGIPSTAFVRNIVVDPSNSNHLFASFSLPDSGSGILASTDAGETWSQVYSVSTEAQDSTEFSMAASAGVVYAGYSDESLPHGGIAVSVDGGATWTDANSGLAYYDLRAFAAASTPNVLYTGGSQGLFKSTDSGADWTPLTIPQLPAAAGLPAGTAVQGIVADPANSSVLYLAEGSPVGCDYTQQNLFKSTDGGVTWNSISPGESGCLIAGIPLTVDPNHSQTLYLAENDSFDDWFDLLKSTDGGATWTSIWSPGTSVVSALAIDPANSTTMYAALEGFSPGDAAGLFKSSDGGATWIPTGLSNVTLTALVIDPSNSMNLYAAESQTVVKSVDGGATWSDASAALQSIAAIGSTITSLVADSTHEGVLYLGTSGNGVYRTTNAGQSWSPIKTRLTGSNVRQLSIVSNSVYAVTTDGVLKLVNP